MVFFVYFLVYVRPLASHNTHFQIIKNIKKNKKVCKIMKKRSQINNFVKIHKELRNPNFHCEWRYVGAMINLFWAQKTKKLFFFFPTFFYYYFWGK